MKDVYVVLKNRDFIEGRGPMLFHTIFSNREDAHNYIMDQPGICGSKQGYRKGSYNGYAIKLTAVRDHYDKEKIASLREKKKDLEDAMDDIRQQLELVESELR